MNQDEVIEETGSEQEDNLRILSHKLISPTKPWKDGLSSPPPRTEDSYFDRIVPGILYSADAGGIIRYVPRSCHNGGPCRVSCRLYNDGECKYEDSLNNKTTMKKPDSQRFIDNVLSIESSSIHPLVDKSPEMGLVVDALRKVESCIPQVPPLPSIESEIDEELKKHG
jgi:hypothetical protein